MAETLTRKQAQTLPARQALAAKFPSSEEKSAHFRELARRSHRRRLTLSGDEAATLAHAYRLLGTIFERAQPDDGVATEEAAGVA